ncbi:MAG TPA: response regulator [Acidimicrobiales bacterium]
MSEPSKPDRVLIVDDDRDIARLIEITLQSEGFDTVVAQNGDDAMQMAKEWQPDAVLLDVMMPGIDGVEVCKQLRSHPATSATSILMLTAKTLPSDRVVGLTAGADDYIAKPFDSEELVARLRTALRRSSHLRGISPLTGLPGNFEIARAIDVLLDSGQEFAVLHADLDDFKAFNDYYGFIQGDEAIVVAAEALASVLADHQGEIGFLGHVGGDDFVMVVDAHLATTIADAAIAAFSAKAPSLYQPEDQLNGWIEVEDRAGTTHRYRLLSMSIGIATAEQRSFSSAGEAAAVAVEMKKLAKAAGGSAWRIDRRRDG